MRVKDLCFLVALCAVAVAVILCFSGYLFAGAGAAVVACAVSMIARLDSLLRPAPMSPALRWVLHLPRGPHSSARVLRAVEPRPGERVLDLGAGDGVHAITVARGLGRAGALHGVDSQLAMLGALRRCAMRAGMDNIACTAADAQALPFADGSFDAAYLVTVLGEIPDPKKALDELARVLRPDGRLVVGEMAADPDYVSPEKLDAMTASAGFELQYRRGTRWAYLSRYSRRKTGMSSQCELRSTTVRLSSGANGCGAPPAGR